MSAPTPGRHSRHRRRRGSAFAWAVAFGGLLIQVLLPVFHSSVLHSTAKEAAARTERCHASGGACRGDAAESLSARAGVLPASKSQGHAVEHTCDLCLTCVSLVRARPVAPGVACRVSLPDLALGSTPALVARSLAHLRMAARGPRGPPRSI